MGFILYNENTGTPSLYVSTTTEDFTKYMIECSKKYSRKECYFLSRDKISLPINITTISNRDLILRALNFDADPNKVQYFNNIFFEHSLKKMPVSILDSLYDTAKITHIHPLNYMKKANKGFSVLNWSKTISQIYRKQINRYK